MDCKSWCAWRSQVICGGSESGLRTQVKNSHSTRHRETRLSLRPDAVFPADCVRRLQRVEDTCTDSDPSRNGWQTMAESTGHTQAALPAASFQLGNNGADPARNDRVR